MNVPPPPPRVQSRTHGTRFNEEEFEMNCMDLSEEADNEGDLENESEDGELPDVSWIMGPILLLLTYASVFCS